MAKKKYNSNKLQIDKPNLLADSHGAFGNIQRLVLLMCDIDRASYFAGVSLHWKSIHQYFVLLYQAYINLKPVITPDDQKVIEKIIKRYNLKYIDLIKTGPSKMSNMFLFGLYSLCQQINEALITCPQRPAKFWFRTSRQELTGFGSVGQLGKSSIFAGSKIIEDDDDDL